MVSALTDGVYHQVPLSAGGDYGYYTNNYAYYSEPAAEKSRRREAKVESLASAAATRDRLVLREPDKE